MGGIAAQTTDAALAGFGPIAGLAKIPLVPWLIMFSALFGRNAAQADLVIADAIRSGINQRCTFLTISARDAEALVFDAVPNGFLACALGNNQSREVRALASEDIDHLLLRRRAAPVIFCRHVTLDINYCLGEQNLECRAGIEPTYTGLQPGA